jgi:hypothetical protein
MKAYPNITTSQFSQQVAEAELNAFQRVINPATGQEYYEGPSEADSYIVARNAWAQINPDHPELADYFPGNVLIAENFAEAGNLAGAQDFINSKNAFLIHLLAVDTDLGAGKGPFGSVVPLYDKTLLQSFSLLAAGGSERVETIPGAGSVLVFRDAADNVYSIFSIPNAAASSGRLTPGLGVPGDAPPASSPTVRQRLQPFLRFSPISFQKASLETSRTADVQLASVFPETSIATIQANLADMIVRGTGGGAPAATAPA